MQACNLLGDARSEHQQILMPSPVFKQNNTDSEDELYGLVAVEMPRLQDVRTDPRSTPKINLKASGGYMLGLY